MTKGKNIKTEHFNGCYNENELLAWIDIDENMNQMIYVQQFGAHNIKIYFYILNFMLQHGLVFNILKQLKVSI